MVQRFWRFVLLCLLNTNVSKGCSVLMTSGPADTFAVANSFMRKRGPDGTYCRKAPAGFTLCHNLLNMTGSEATQPFVDEHAEQWALFNGEIYNYKKLLGQGALPHHGDGAAILPTYNRYGTTFARHFDGEFAVVLIDFSASSTRLILAVDTFGTKPLWYSLHEGFHAATYMSALEGLGVPTDSVRAVPPNTILIFSLSYKSDPVVVSLVERRVVFEFDLRQYSSLDQGRWKDAFSRAVRMRAQHGNHPIFIGLSAGYDSGAIHSELLYQRLPHVTYSISGEEDAALLESRFTYGLCHSRMTAVSHLIQLSKGAFKRERTWALHNIELFKYIGIRGHSNLRDGATFGLSAICRDARQRGGFLVYISGAGGDEIQSDYGNRGEPYNHRLGSFWGLFPEDLGNLFPWENFFLGVQRDFLMKEEAAAGAHGVEARYPFLDRRVVQEFLWLSVSEKNSQYKAPLRDLFTQHGYPFHYSSTRYKTGFLPGEGGPLDPDAVLTRFLPTDCSVWHGDSHAGLWARIRWRQWESAWASRWGPRLAQASATGTIRYVRQDLRKMCIAANRTDGRNIATCHTRHVIVAGKASGQSAIANAFRAKQTATLQWLLDAVGCPSEHCNNLLRLELSNDPKLANHEIDLMVSALQPEIPEKTSSEIIVAPNFDIWQRETSVDAWSLAVLGKKHSSDSEDSPLQPMALRLEEAHQTDGSRGHFASPSSEATARFTTEHHEAKNVAARR